MYTEFRQLSQGNANAFRPPHLPPAGRRVSFTCTELPAYAGGTLRVLAWPGYADSDLVQDFERRFGVNVEVSFVSSDDMLRNRISANQGGDFDVFAANTAEMQHYIAQKLIVPLQLSAIPNTAHQLPRFRNLEGIPGIAAQGQLFAIPYTYSEMGLIYDRKQFKPRFSISSNS